MRRLTLVPLTLLGCALDDAALPPPTLDTGEVTVHDTCTANLPLPEGVHEEVFGARYRVRG